MALVNELIELGMVPQLAKKLADAISSAVPAAVPAANITGLDAAVETAVASKTEIAALTSGSDAADIVAALKA